MEQRKNETKKVTETRPPERRRFQVIKLEERIAPRNEVPGSTHKFMPSGMRG